jgi:hypothetical protein
MPRQVFPTLILAALAAAGCSKTADSAAPPSAEADVRAAVAALQEAVKAKDAARVWDLLDAKSQSDADQAAAAVQGKLKAADAAGKAELEKQYGLPPADLEKLDGPGYLRTAVFWAKYHELPESKITEVHVTGKKATVYYTEPDGDKEKFDLAQRDGKWKAQLEIPK